LPNLLVSMPDVNSAFRRSKNYYQEAFLFVPGAGQNAT